MEELEKQLRQFKAIEPDSVFCDRARERLLARILNEADERWFVTLIRKVGQILPRPEFLMRARQRLIAHAIPRPSLGWAVFFRRLAASTLIMILAVTSTLFFIDGKQMVNASEDTYLEVLKGPVSVKRADRLTWDTVGINTDLAAGDLIRVSETGLATIHFFDDSQVRLSASSLLLINRINPSPVFDRQGILDLTLSSGRAWAQTLNVEDGFTRFILSTPAATVESLNSSFDVALTPDQPLVVRVFKNRVDLKTAETQSLSTHQKAIVRNGKAIVGVLPDADRVQEWVQNNLKKDREHLVLVRERELASLQQSAGVLPGNMLYPLKLAKERLGLALAFGDKRLNQTQIDIANKRLNEAMVLLEKGEQTKAREALQAYNNITRQIAESAKTNQTLRGEVSQKILAQNQKVLVAALPTSSPIRVVQDALDATEELLAGDSLEREQIRLDNSMEDLNRIMEFVLFGDLASAKASIAEHPFISARILEEAKTLPPDDRKAVFKEVLAWRNMESKMLEEMAAYTLAENGQDAELLALLATANQNAEFELKNTLNVIESLNPELVYAPAPVAVAPNLKIQNFIDRVQIYTTWRGQKNQVARLLKEDVTLQRDIPFLESVRQGLSDPRTKALINTKILSAQKRVNDLKHKEMKRRIERAKRLRQ